MLLRTMQKLEPPDTHALSAALGWLELGNAREALAELDLVSAANQDHAGVLELRWAARAELRDWAGALHAANRLVDVAPDNVSGWLHRAYALRRAPGGGLPQAWDALLPAADKFPDQLLVAFNLACYACQLQRLDAAREWLHRAMKLGQANEVRAMALADADLEPLWLELQEG
jgi:tetratricopeptide (TPR) repeat protein